GAGDLPGRGLLAPLLHDAHRTPLGRCPHCAAGALVRGGFLPCENGATALRRLRAGWSRPLRKDRTMILINVTFPVKPAFAAQWPEITREFTETTLAEPGNLWFEWSRSVEDPNTYVLIEAFTDEGAGPHVDSPHFKTMQEEFPQYLSATPQIISHQIDSDGWGPMGEITVE